MTIEKGYLKQAANSQFQNPYAIEVKEGNQPIVIPDLWQPPPQTAQPQQPLPRTTVQPQQPSQPLPQTPQNPPAQQQKTAAAEPQAFQNTNRTAAQFLESPDGYISLTQDANETNRAVSFNRIVPGGADDGHINTSARTSILADGREVHQYIDWNSRDSFTGAIYGVRDRIISEARSGNPGSTPQIRELQEVLRKPNWSLEDRRTWEKNLSWAVSEAVDKIPGLQDYRNDTDDKYSYAASDGTTKKVQRTNRLNDVSTDIDGNKKTKEVDCETFTATEGSILQMIENDLLPKNAVDQADHKRAGSYYYATGNMYQGTGEQPGGHAFIVSPSGAIIEATTDDGACPYKPVTGRPLTPADLTQGRMAATINDRGTSACVYGFGDNKPNMDAWQNEYRAGFNSPEAYKARSTYATRFVLEALDKDYTKMNAEKDWLYNDPRFAHKTAEGCTIKIAGKEMKMVDLITSPEDRQRLQQKYDECYTLQSQHMITRLNDRIAQAADKDMNLLWLKTTYEQESAKYGPHIRPQHSAEFASLAGRFQSALSINAATTLLTGMEQTIAPLRGENTRARYDDNNTMKNHVNGYTHTNNGQSVRLIDLVTNPQDKEKIQQKYDEFYALQDRNGQNQVTAQKTQERENSRVATQNIKNYTAPLRNAPSGSSLQEDSINQLLPFLSEQTKYISDPGDRKSLKEDFEVLSRVTNGRVQNPFNDNRTSSFSAEKDGLSDGGIEVSKRPSAAFGSAAEGIAAAQPLHDDGLNNVSPQVTSTSKMGLA